MLQGVVIVRCALLSSSRVRFFLLVATPLLALLLCCRKGHAEAGTSGGNVLNMQGGARAIGMGEAYTAQADDVSSLYWNPAGIALLNQSQASFMYNDSFQGLSYNHFAVATPLEQGGLGG